MVQHLRVSRTHLRRDNPHVFGKVHFHQNVLVGHRAGRGHIEVLGHLDDHVRLDIPAVMKGDRSRLVLRVAFHRAAVRPRTERHDFRVGQSLVVREMPVRRIREPGRHLPLDDSGLDRFRPRTRVLVGQERHRRDLARAMARLTVLLQNRQHMLVERDGSSRRILLRHGVNRSRHRSQHQQARPKSANCLKRIAPPGRCQTTGLINIKAIPGLAGRHSEARQPVLAGRAADGFPRQFPTLPTGHRGGDERSAIRGKSVVQPTGPRST